MDFKLNYSARPNPGGTAMYIITDQRQSWVKPYWAITKSEAEKGAAALNLLESLAEHRASGGSIEEMQALVTQGLIAAGLTPKGATANGCATTEDKRLDMYVPFTGDGRRKVKPSKEPRIHTRPLSLTYAKARQIIQQLVLDGNTYHSGAGGTLWVLEEWAKANKVELKVVPNIRTQPEGMPGETKPSGYLCSLEKPYHLWLQQFHAVIMGTRK